MLNKFGITEDELKKYIRAKMDGKDIPSPLSKLPPNMKVEEPKIPTKEELQKMIDQKVPSDEEIDGMAEDVIRGKIPNIPYVNFIPPTTRFSTKTNLLIDPFINLARIHLLSRGGTMMVMAQYPPPAPPAPAVLIWQGYNVRNGPPIPPLIPAFPIALGLGKLLRPEKGAVTPEQADKDLQEKLNPPVPVSGSIILASTGVISNIPQIGSTINPNQTNVVSLTGGQTITDKTLAQNNINKNKC